MRKSPLSVAALFFLAICCFGQDSTSTVRTSAGGFVGSAQFGQMPPMPARAVTGAPYSGEEVTEQIQTLADGTHITHKSEPIKMYRDSLGRTRTERPAFPALAMNEQLQNVPTIVEIVDPIAQVKYTLDTVNKVAHRQELPSAAARMGGQGGGQGQGAGWTFTSARAVNGAAVTTGAPQATTIVANNVGNNVATIAAPNAPPPPLPAMARNRPRPEMSTEKLGIQNIEGVAAEGTRTTSTWAIGSVGNDRPIAVVNEMWMSTELKVMVLSKSNDPRSGEHTTKLTNISQGDPPASLFQPPPEYSVADEKGAFNIKWGQR
jgi:hypothetical protein